MLRQWRRGQNAVRRTRPNRISSPKFIQSEVSMKARLTVDFFVVDLVLSQLTKNIRDVPRPFIRNRPDCRETQGGFRGWTPSWRADRG